MKGYYEWRAVEYDDVWLDTGRYSEQDRPGWKEEVETLAVAPGELRPAHALDVACGTDFLTGT